MEDTNPEFCFFRSSFVYSRAGEELVKEDAHRPVVDRSVVALVQDDLRRHVLGGAAEGPRLAAHAEVLAESKVDLLETIEISKEKVQKYRKVQLRKFVTCYKNRLWFKIT